MIMQEEETEGRDFMDVVGAWVDAAVNLTEATLLLRKFRSNSRDGWATASLQVR